MLELESKWLKDKFVLLNICSDSIILNFGSQDERVYKYQPYLYNNVISEINNRKARILNLDIKHGSGIDIVGDITDEKTIMVLKEKMITHVLCTNVLEHVENITTVCINLERVINKNGFIIVTVPYRFPKHYDPIDNGFRPNIEEVASLFPHCEIVDSEIVIDHNYMYYLSTNWLVALKFIGRLFTPFYRYDRWKNTILPKLYWLNKPYAVTCVILRKIK